MRTLHTEIEIESSAECVWSILTNFSGYHRWNPFITEINGTPEEGARLQVRINPPGSKAMTFKPAVTRITEARELRWRGRLLFAGLFDGEHIFTIEPRGANLVRFVQRENFSGLLVPLLWKSIEASTREGFLQMNQALKSQAEAKPDQLQ